MNARLLQKRHGIPIVAVVADTEIGTIGEMEVMTEAVEGEEVTTGETTTLPRLRVLQRLDPLVVGIGVTTVGLQERRL